MIPFQNAMKNTGMLACLALTMMMAKTTPALAGDYYTTVTPAPIATGAGDPVTVDLVPGKEYSHNSNTISSTMSLSDSDAFGASDPEQVISFDGILPAAYVAGGLAGSGSTDSFDYSMSRAPLNDTIDRQVDALANSRDALFDQVVSNSTPLLISVHGDFANGSSTGPVIPGPPAIFYEKTDGTTGVWAYVEQVNHHFSAITDVDGLEIYGPEPGTHGVGESAIPAGDANIYSVDRDPDPMTGIDTPMGKVSAYQFIGPPGGGAGMSSPYLMHSAVVKAVELVTGVTIAEDADRYEIEVDALMVKDNNGGDNAADIPSAMLMFGDIGDEIIFSTDPFSLSAAASSLTFDGGELIHLKVVDDGGGGPMLMASYLSHGGHVWDTAHDVALRIGEPMRLGIEDIDAIEAVGVMQADVVIPEPSVYALLAGMVTVSLVRRRMAEEV